MKAKILAGALIASAALAASPAAAVTTFTNNWDSTFFAGTGFKILSSYEGWTSVAGGGIEVQHGNVAGAPLSGRNLVELDSTSNSTMERFIDAGVYRLNFFYSARPNVPASSNGISVFANGAQIYNVTGAGTGMTNWMAQSVKFSIGKPGSLRFAAVGTSNSLGGYLENLSLSGAVPEPATWGMLILGFGAVGTAMRLSRRRESQSAIA